MRLEPPSGKSHEQPREQPAEERLIAPGNEEWPEGLSEIGPHRRIERVFVAGARLDAGSPAVGIVGTRRPTAAGLAAAGEISRGLAEAGFAIVSGLAVGIDAAAHWAALEAGGRTVAVLGCGLDVDYPVRNRALKSAIAGRGTLVSEYARGSQVVKHHFPERNRIIAGLCLGVVVVEGAITSGALVTARLALDANRFVWAVPGSLRNPMAAGPNELIKRSGAALITSVADVFDDLVPGLVWAEPSAARGEQALLRPDEQEVLEALDDVAVAPDLLARVTALKPGHLAAVLARLEIRGLAARAPGGYVVTGKGAAARGAGRRAEKGE